MHSPAPWKLNEHGEIFDKNNVPVYSGGGFQSEGDLARVVACVNACKGLSNLELEKAYCLLAVVEIPEADVPPRVTPMTDEEVKKWIEDVKQQNRESLKNLGFDTTDPNSP